MNKNVKTISFYLIVAIAAYLIGRSLSPAVTRVAASSIAMSPFVMRQQVFAPTAEGLLKITEDRVTAIAADGTEVRFSTRPNQPERGKSFLIIRPDGSASTSNSFLGAKMSGFLSRRRMEGRQLRPLQKIGGCKTPHEKAIGLQEILGISVAEVQQSDAASRYTSWRAMDFGCIEVRMTKEAMENNQWKMVIAAFPVSFQPGAPPDEFLDESSLKTLPELSPSQMRDLANQKMGITAASCPKCFDSESIQKQEDAYRARQVRP